jgi:hypothetical protein
MRNWLYNGVFLALVMAGLSSCGGGGAAKTITTEDFCDDKAAAECSGAAPHCGNNESKCKTARKAVCLTAVDAAMVGQRKFTAANISLCISQSTNVYKSMTAISPTQLNMMDDACAYVFQGNGAKLDTCDTKYDCQTGLICDKGRCATKIAKNKGDLCSDPGAICNAGSICKKDDANGVFACAAKGGANEACDADTNPCIEALHCAGGTCVNRATSGMDCMSNDDCATAVPYCDDSIGNKCDLGLNLGPGSKACMQFGEP